MHTCQSRRHVFLDGHRAVQGMVKRLVDHAKTAHPQKPQDFKLSQPGAGRQRINVADAGGRGLAGTFDHGEREQDRSERALNGACQASRLGNRRDDAISKPVEKPQKSRLSEKTSQAAGRL